MQNNDLKKYISIEKIAPKICKFGVSISNINVLLKFLTNSIHTQDYTLGQIEVLIGRIRKDSEQLKKEYNNFEVMLNI